jgi:hypothetical protein
MDSIAAAKNLVVLGYSLPLGDRPTRTMFSLALSRNNLLQKVQIVLGTDEGDSGYQQWRDFCSAVGKTAQPIYTTFEEFVLGNVTG